MTKEEKQLLLVDLCARLPYGVKCYIEFDDGKIFLGRTLMPIMIQDFKSHECLVIKPYLLPMSSMTEEERKEYELLANHCIVTSIGFIHLEVASLIDWLNRNHFDYRGLIEKGLAIEVTEDNNPYK